MRQPATTFRLLLVLLAAVISRAQVPGGSSPQVAHRAIRKHPEKTAATPPSETISDPGVVYLDAAHGGSDAGAVLNGNVTEKDVTLALAMKLRALLATSGFRVIMTRVGPADVVSEDQRIDLANRSRASACLLLHASNGGHGVHLYSSSLTGTTNVAHKREEGSGPIVPWDTAQAPSLSSSLDLQNVLASALNGIRIPLVTGRASVSPIDSTSCPAVAVELAPYTPAGGAVVQPSDDGYQQRVAEAIVTALTFRREHLQAKQSPKDTQSINAPTVSSKSKLIAKAKPAAGAAPRTQPAQTPFPKPPAPSHTGSPGVRALPGVTPHPMPAPPAAKPEPQGPSL